MSMFYVVCGDICSSQRLRRRNPANRLNIKKYIIPFECEAELCQALHEMIIVEVCTVSYGFLRCLQCFSHTWIR